MPYRVYALVSLSKAPRLYVGFSHNPPERLKDHNYGRVTSTKGYRPWKLVFIDDYVCATLREARQREKYWKSGVGKEKLKKYAAVAQLVERVHGKDKVRSSILRGGSGK